MSYIGHLDLSKVFDGQTKERLILQSQQPAPKISNEYYLGESDFFEVDEQLKRNKKYENSLLKYHKNNSQDRIKKFSMINVNTLQEHLRINCSDEAKKMIAESYITYNPEFRTPESAIAFLETKSRKNYLPYFLSSLSQELFKKFGLVSNIITHRVHERGKQEVLFVCLPQEVAKDKSGQLTLVKKDKAEAQFFGYLVARGVIDEKFLLDSPVALGKNYHQILSVIKQLRDEGVEPILAEPIHKYKNPNELSR